MSVDNDKKHSNTELFGSSSLMSEDLLSFVPSESMFKFNRLNLNQIDQNKVKETLQNQKDDFLNKMSSVTSNFIHFYPSFQKLIVH